MVRGHLALVVVPVCRSGLEVQLVFHLILPHHFQTVLQHRLLHYVQRLDSLKLNLSQPSSVSPVHLILRSFDHRRYRHILIVLELLVLLVVKSTVPQIQGGIARTHFFSVSFSFQIYGSSNYAAWIVHFLKTAIKA